MNAARSASSLEQPPSPGRLSLGLFLASGVILFGGVLTGYALLRINDPGSFSWAPSLLNRRLGLFTAAALVAASLAAAGALRFALAAKVEIARRLLVVTLLAGTAVVVLRVLEFPSTSRRAGLVHKSSEAAPKTHEAAPAVALAHIGDASQGKRIFLGTCAACHAPDGSGVKGQGQNLRDSLFLKDKTDEQALAFVKVGRQPFDPESKLHLTMPARGGNPSLSDANLLDAIAYVRELEKQAAPIAGASATSATPSKPLAQARSSDEPQVIDGELWLPHSIFPEAQAGPPGAAPAAIALQKPGAEGRSSSSVHRFFAFVLFVDGLHTIYLLFGLALGVWLCVSTARTSSPRSSLAWTATYWMVIAAIGILLIPAFYI
jgi:heme/copper-type cytochrome/quinol oxidase subunit 3